MKYIGNLEQLVAWLPYMWGVVAVFALIGLAGWCFNKIIENHEH